jgi:1A family penicillin-binding protein
VRVLVRYLLTVSLAAMGLTVALVLSSRSVSAIAAAGQSRTTTSALQLAELSERSVVYDRGGNVLAVLHADENRSPVTLDQVPDHVVNAILDVEDDSFFQHGGVDLRSILRAAITNAESGELKQGGSTITQQLVKQSLLTPERNLQRKVKEAVYAMRLEDQMTKQQILEQYLNTVYFGYGAYGVQAAAETYWGIEAKDLTVVQGAFLAGIIRNPVGYDPFKRPDVTKARRDVALQRMVSQHHLSQAEADRLKRVPLPQRRHDPLPTRDDYFLEEVKQRLLDDTRLGETAQERYNAVFRGGLRIETTYDPRLQQLAEDAVNRNIPDTKGRFVGALVSIEPTGAVRAMVAGKGFEQAHYNLATGRGGSGRQPGSSFKTFVLLTAMENGYGPNDIINGSEPCRVHGIKGQKPDPYEPGNYEGTRGGTGPIHQAIAKSLNCAAIRLGLSLDPDPIKSLGKVKEMANRLGLDRVKDAPISISLGAEEVTPLQMASAYSVLPADGVRHEPYFVQRVLDRRGKVLFEVKKNDGGERVLEPNVARSAVWTLRKVVEGGTGTKAKLPGRDVAGKTGTSQEWRDAWFVGFTPQLVTAVWMGNPNKQDSMRNVGGIRVTGGSYPARTWNAFMKDALAGQPALKFVEPDLSSFGKPKPVKVPKQVMGGSTSARRTPTSTTSTPELVPVAAPA